MPGDYNNFTPNQNIQSLGANGLYGWNNQGGSGTPIARSDMDSLRIGTGRVPSAEYPDGYLGTIRSRRDDRLLDSIKNRVNQKAYQRGVHKGERIEPSSYYWAPEFGSQMGIQRQMKAQLMNVNGGMQYFVPRAAPEIRLTPAPKLVNDGKANTTANQPGTINVRRSSMLNYLKPVWS
jgi:hypothetical protein